MRNFLAFILAYIFQGRWFAPYFPRVLFYASTEEKVVALTIDDSPTEHTASILDVLKEYNAHATFFVIGGQASDLLARIHSEGHEMGNRTMHDRASIRLNATDLEVEIRQTNEIIQRHGQRDVRWFRPGSGFFTSTMLGITEKMGLRTVLGSVYPHDPLCTDASQNAHIILRSVRPGDIIIIHDRAWTVPMLHIVLKTLSRAGFIVTTLSDLVGDS